MTNEITPLASDPNRQATDTIKGYVYQAWESLHAWINLKEDEVLYLEGAEDVDLLSPPHQQLLKLNIFQKT